MQTTATDVLPEIVRRLVAEFDPEAIILFGSRAWGIPRPDSDYDLFMIVTESDEHPVKRESGLMIAFGGPEYLWTSS